MRLYYQRTGLLYRNDLLIASGLYSGFGEGKNNPLMQHVPNLGPIPQGAYYIGDPSTSLDHGPVALHLIPLRGTQTFGRSGFLWHGDLIAKPGFASHGCIVSQRPLRESARDDDDKLLLVLSGSL